MYGKSAGVVVPGLIEAMRSAEAEADAEGQELWRHRLFKYLDRAFQVCHSLMATATSCRCRALSKVVLRQLLLLLRKHMLSIKGQCS